MEPAELRWHRERFRLERTVQFFERGLDLGAPTFCLVSRYELIALPEELVFAAVEVDGEILVMRGDLRSKVSAARVHHEELLAVGCSVDLDKMVSAAERAQASA